MAFKLTLPAFADGGLIPGLHTCESADISPSLEWSGKLAATRGLAIFRPRHARWPRYANRPSRLSAARRISAAPDTAGLAAGVRSAQIDTAMRAHILAEAQYRGRYERI
jgi:phosphatidylethanolamine-binding protein (PEBP) family uncharacterized protein